MSVHYFKEIQRILFCVPFVEGISDYQTQNRINKERVIDTLFVYDKYGKIANKAVIFIDNFVPVYLLLENLTVIELNVSSSEQIRVKILITNINK